MSILDAERPQAQSIRSAERQTLSVPDACKVLGISRPVGYALIKRGEFPVPVIRLGRRIVIGRQALENLLSGVATPDQDAA